MPSFHRDSASTSEKPRMSQDAPEFKIEDNVLIGKEVSNWEKCPHVGELVLERLKSKPNFIGQVVAVTGEQSTFREMRERSVKCAIWLKRQGIGPRDIVGICADNNSDTCVPVFATLYVAAVISGWDHDMSVASARFFLSLITPKLVFANAAMAENLKKAAEEEKLDTKIITIGRSDGFLSLAEIYESIDSKEVEEFRCTPISDPKQPAMICWSSGTTGLPKGTELSYSSVYNSVTPIEEVNLVDHVSMWTPTIRWHYGLTMIIETVLSNAKNVIIPDADDDIGFVNFINKYEVNYFACDPCVPVRWAKTGLLEDRGVPTLKKFVLSGAHFNALSQQAVAKVMPHMQILQCYGATDAGGLCISQAKNSKPGSCGFVCKGFQIKVVDVETGVALGPNKKGELWIKSPFVMNGYYRNPEATRKAIDGDGWLHTNDLGYYDEDGEIFLVDRMSEFINYRSIKLSPAEIESAVENHPSVLKAAVVAVPHDTDEEHPMAFVKKVSGKEVTEEELISLVKSTLPWYCQLLGGVKFVDEFPRTTTGKIAKKQLKELAKSYVTANTA